MAYVAKICNPTLWEVKINFERGVVLRIPALGSLDLSMQQMDDFRPGKPGSENVLSYLDYHGAFLLDGDRPYDHQALEALKKAYAARKSQYDQVVQNAMSMRAAQGINPDPSALEETLRQQGYVRFREHLDTIREQIQKLEAVVADNPERTVRARFDPTRTVFVLEPPREFPSVAAMEFFLEKNPDIKAKHDEFVKATQKPVSDV